MPADVLQRARLVFANYPNNPTAAVATPSTSTRLVNNCRKHGILLAYDNAYCELTYDGYRAPSIFEIPGARDVAIEFFSLSKSYSMTGWRIGFAVGRSELIGALTRVKSYVDTGPWLAIQQAAVAALDNSDALVAPVRAELERRRDAGVAALNANGIACEAPHAAMYLWVPLPPGVASAPFTRRVLEETGVVLLPGSGFGPAGEGYFRIALTVGAARLEEAARRIASVLTPTPRRRTRRGALRMKLLDTDETILLVTGTGIAAEERDRPLAYWLKGEIDQRGASHPYRRGIVVGDAWYVENRIFQLNPADHHRRSGRERRCPRAVRDAAGGAQRGRPGVRADGDFG